MLHCENTKYQYVIRK